MAGLRLGLRGVGVWDVFLEDGAIRLRLSDVAETVSLAYCGWEVGGVTPDEEKAHANDLVGDRSSLHPPVYFVRATVNCRDAAALCTMIPPNPVLRRQVIAIYKGYQAACPPIHVLCES
jgi:UDP:flavonoid glycosyltransferase YjiC (YdhE family)